LKRYFSLGFFGMDKGWREITSGADIKVPLFILNIYIPVLLIIIFLGSLFKPLGKLVSEMFLVLETDG
jgi:hypothetical protein